MRNSEGLLDETGGCGRCQVILVPLSLITGTMLSWSMLLVVFGALEPDWWCLSPPSLNGSGYNASSPAWNGDEFGTLANSSETPGDLNYSLLLSAPLDKRHPMYKVCPSDSGPGSLCETIVFEPGIKTFVSQFQLVCGKSWVPATIFSIQMAAVLLGTTAGSQMSDLAGRKKAALIFVIMHTVMSAACSFANSWQLFIGLRAVLGVSLGATVNIIYLYPNEFVTNRWRPLLASLPSWSGGSIAFSLLVWRLKDWVHVQIATAVFSAACIPAWVVLPESYRWLLTKGRVAEAQAVLTKMAARNRRAAPSMQRLQGVGIGLDRQAGKRYHFGHLFSSWRLVKVSLVIGYVSLACSLTYYGIYFGTKDLSGNFFLNLLLMSLVEMIPNLIIYPMAGRVGRRLSILCGALVLGVCCFSVVAVSLTVAEAHRGTVVNGLCFAARFFINFTWSIMDIYILELYPTVIRNVGSGYASLTGRIGGIIAPHLSSLGGVHALYAVIGTCITLAGLLLLCLGDTKGRPMQDQIQAEDEAAKPEGEEQLPAISNGETEA